MRKACVMQQFDRKRVIIGDRPQRFRLAPGVKMTEEEVLASGLEIEFNA